MLPFLIEKPWKSKKRYVFGSPSFPPKCPQLILGYFLKHYFSCFRVIFSKASSVADIFLRGYRIWQLWTYLSNLVAQRQLWRLLMKPRQDIYICCWFFECNYSACTLVKAGCIYTRSLNIIYFTFLWFILLIWFSLKVWITR